MLNTVLKTMQAPNFNPAILGHTAIQPCAWSVTPPP